MLILSDLIFDFVCLLQERLHRQRFGSANKLFQDLDQRFFVKNQLGQRLAVFSDSKSKFTLNKANLISGHAKMVVQAKKMLS
jgi:hypothetical protein